MLDLVQSSQASDVFYCHSRALGLTSRVLMTGLEWVSDLCLVERGRKREREREREVERY